MRKMDVVEAHKFSDNNRQSLPFSFLAGCFYCCSIYSAGDVKEWIDDGKTALCPICRIDSVLASMDVDFDPDFLKEMHDYWFENKQE